MAKIVPFTLHGSHVTVQDRINSLFQLAPDFKTWVEQTSLFDSIKNRKKVIGVDFYEIRAKEITIRLKDNVIVNKAEDLPIELIENFYINSPFYNPKINIKKLLDYEITD